MKKEKVLKILLWLSVLPYVFLLVISVSSWIFGFTAFFTTYSGFEAFYTCAFLWGFLLCTEIPVIPVCLAYQIGFGIWCFVKRRREKAK